MTPGRTPARGGTPVAVLMTRSISVLVRGTRVPLTSADSAAIETRSEVGCGPGPSVRTLRKTMTPAGTTTRPAEVKGTSERARKGCSVERAPAVIASERATAKGAEPAGGGAADGAGVGGGGVYGDALRGAGAGVVGAGAAGLAGRDAGLGDDGPEAAVAEGLATVAPATAEIALRIFALVPGTDRATVPTKSCAACIILSL